MRWIVHLLPLQRSASVKLLLALPEKYPTAVHALPDVHDTPLRAGTTWPGGLGIGWVDQVLPLQRSAKTSFWKDPTAVHRLPDVHDTPLKVAPPERFGVCWIDQPAATATPGKHSRASTPPINPDPPANLRNAPVPERPDENSEARM
jgi:hypothetical protein